MKRICVFILISLSACGDVKEDKRQSEEVVIQNGEVTKASSTDTLCFILTEGNNNQDTQAVKLIVTGDVVEGKMMYMPAEKDWRFGNLKGMKAGAQLDLVWTFVQEGMKDSSQVVMKINGDQLLQKSVSYYPETGREFIADTATFTTTYKKVDCTNFPKQDFDIGL